MKIKHIVFTIKSIFVKTILMVLLILCYNWGYSMFVGNYLDKGFIEKNGEEVTTNETAPQESIKNLIIKSATYFLRGKAGVDWLASEMETSEIANLSFFELQQIVNEAMSNFKTARCYYLELKNRTTIAPYNQEVINQLIYFDYDSFLNQKGLNRDIYGQVRSYLQKGNVRGIFDRFYNDIENIIQMLETIQHNVSYSEAPGLEISWKINQACAHMLLFGQYSSQIFYALI